MKRLFIRILVVTIVLSFAAASYAAEAVKLMFKSSIYFDAAGQGLKRPEGVACTGKDSVIVADTDNGRLLKYTYQEDVLKGGEEIKVPQVAYPLKVQTDSKGDIFALDGKQRRIVELAPDGTFKKFIDPTDLPAPTALVARSFKIDRSDAIYVLDIFSGRVLVLDPSGKYVRHLDFPEKYGFFSDLAVDTQGTIYLLDAVDARVYTATKDAKSFTPLGEKLEDYVNFPTNILVDDKGMIYLADQNGSGVVVLDQSGAFRGRLVVFGWKDGLVRYPSQLCMNDKGEFFVADRENSRIEMFNVIR